MVISTTTRDRGLRLGKLSLEHHSGVILKASGQREVYFDVLDGRWRDELNEVDDLNEFLNLWCSFLEFFHVLDLCFAVFRECSSIVTKLDQRHDLVCLLGSDTLLRDHLLLHFLLAYFVQLVNDRADSSEFVLAHTCTKYYCVQYSSVVDHDLELLSEELKDFSNDGQNLCIIDSTFVTTNVEV